MTITDKRMTRFWITLDQAFKLVINALEHMQGGEIFLPKIPSMKIMDLTKAIAPECEIDIIGIRPGEKIHEVLITEEEGRYAIEYNGMYIILPNYSWWNRQNYTTGKKLPKGFTYMSNTNMDWLSVNDLKTIIDNYTDSVHTNLSNPSEEPGNNRGLQNESLNTDIYSNGVSRKSHGMTN